MEKCRKDVGRRKSRNDRNFLGNFLKRRREVLKRTSVGGNIGRTSVGRNLEMIDIFLVIFFEKM